MLGDFLREAAVLVIVFYPLERYFNLQHPDRVGDPPSGRTVIGLSLLLLIAGMALERIDFGALAVWCLDIAVGTLSSIRDRISKRRGQ
jgi:hypothetical protein